MKNLFIQGVIFLICLSLAQPISADEIHLVNGSIYTVKSWKFQGDYLSMELKDGRTMQVRREKVKKISIDRLKNNPDVVTEIIESPSVETRITYSVSRDLALPESVLGHMNSNNIAAALIAIENTGEDYKKTIDYHFLRGSLLLAAGHFAECNAVVSEKLTENPAFPGSKYSLALSSYFLGHIQEATKVIESIGVEEVPVTERARVIRTFKELELLKKFTPFSSLNLTILADSNIKSRGQISLAADNFEFAFNKLSRMLKYVPPQPVLVIITDHKLFRISESLGSYDGKIVIPFQVLGTREEKIIISHELVHSFLLSKTRGNCPVWLHEGLAQTLSGMNIDDRPDPYLIYVNSGKKMTIYPDSLATSEYLLNSYGMEQILNLLTELENGIYPQEALKLVFQKSYDEILHDRDMWLSKKLFK